MAPFARMIPGEWKMTTERGISQFERWAWGPGQHSMRVLTDGFGGDGQPWRALRVVYWHPGLQAIRMLGISPYARGVSEGTLTVKGDFWEAFCNLDQTPSHRLISQRWRFDSPDSYHSMLLEAIPPAQPDYQMLAEWVYVRSELPTPPRPFAVEGVTEPSEFLQPLAFLLGSWESTRNEATGDVLKTRTIVEWIPLADAIVARVSEAVAERASIPVSASEESSVQSSAPSAVQLSPASSSASSLVPGSAPPATSLLDVYLFDHTGRRRNAVAAGTSPPTTLRCLALTRDGAVYEGDVRILKGDGVQDGGLQLELTRSLGELVEPWTVRVERKADGTLRTRAWNGHGATRALRFDATSRTVQPSAGGAAGSSATAGGAAARGATGI